jgi:hypothetical protein
MKLTKLHLKQIIKEELQNLIQEQTPYIPEDEDAPGARNCYELIQKRAWALEPPYRLNGYAAESICDERPDIIFIEDNEEFRAALEDAAQDPSSYR